MIECKTCKAYVHYGCTNLPRYQIIVFEQTSRLYMCSSCATKKFRIPSEEVNFCSLTHRPTTQMDSHTQADSCTQTDTHTQTDSYTQADSYSSNVTHADSCTINQQLQSINRSLVVMEETISLSLEQRVSDSAQINVSEKINELEKAKQLYDYEKKLLNKEIQLYQRENKQLKAELDKKPDITKLQQVNYDSALENENLKLKMKELELSIQFREKETEMIRKNHETEIDLLKKQIQICQQSSSQLEQSRKPIIQYETQAHEVHSCQVFAGYKNALSNFFPCQLYYKGQSFASSEHLYQYLKAEYHDQPEICHEIINCGTANQAMYVGRKIVPSSSWYDCCDQKMNFVLELKAKQCSDFRKALEDSRDNILIEGTTDKYWGAGLRFEESKRLSPTNIPGKNKLGVLLMDIRNKLNEIPVEKKNTALIIGASNTNKIDEKRLTGKCEIRKVVKYNTKDTTEFVRSEDLSEVKCIYINSMGVNDVEKMSTEECVSGLVKLVTTTLNNNSNSKVVVSEILPRRENPTLNQKIKKVNILVKSSLIDTPVIFHDHSYLCKYGVPDMKFFDQSDVQGKHLSKEGISLMAANIKWQIRECLYM